MTAGMSCFCCVVVYCCCHRHCRQAEGAYVYAYLSNLDAPEVAKPPDRPEPPSSESFESSKNLPGPSTTNSRPGSSTSSAPKSSSGDGIGDIRKASRAQTREVSACLITLSDSDSDEDLPPLSTRLQKTSASRDNEPLSTRLQKTSASRDNEPLSTRLQKTSASRDNERRAPSGTTVSKGEHGGASSSSGFGAKSPPDSVRSKERLSLTPSQAAGRAALDRWKSSGPSESTTSPPAPEKSTVSLSRPPKSRPPISPPVLPKSTAPPPRPPKSGEGSAEGEGRKEKNNLDPQKLATSRGEGSTEVRGRGKESQVDLSEPEFVFSPGEMTRECTFSP